MSGLDIGMRSSNYNLTEQEKALMRACEQRDIIYKSQDRFQSKWIEEVLKIPIVYLCAICFISSSMAILGFDTDLPTIITDLEYEADMECSPEAIRLAN